jgi:hypothetical protein
MGDSEAEKIGELRGQLDALQSLVADVKDTQKEHGEKIILMAAKLPELVTNEVNKQQTAAINLAVTTALNGMMESRTAKRDKLVSIFLALLAVVSPIAVVFVERIK